MATKWSEEFKDIKNILNNGYEYTENDYIDVNYFNMLVRNVLGHYSNINDLSNKVQENKDNINEELKNRFLMQNETNDDLYENIRNIKSRLDTLGFKEGTFIINGNESSQEVYENSIKKQGKYVIANLHVTNENGITNIIIPEGFRPKEDIMIYCRAFNNSKEVSGIEIKRNGEIPLTSVYNFTYFAIQNAGWEIA